MSENASMLDAVLIPAGTVITDKGDSPIVDLSTSENRVFLLDLKIAEAVEQEYIELSLLGSADGTTFAAQPLAALPQRFYAGSYPTLVDLTADPATKYLRIHWEVSRWGRGETKPRFVCAATLREVAPEALREARVEAQSRR